MATNNKTDLEHLSSLIDGELDAHEAAALLETLCRDAELQRRWSDLQLVGDAIRSSDVAACHVEGFCARVHIALAEEPTVLAPPRSRAAWRRYALPGVAIAASVAAIAFIAVPLLKSPTGDVLAARKAADGAPVAVAAGQPQPASPIVSKAASAIANARALDPYFAAHRELTGGTPLPRATAYLRTSAEDR